MSWAIPEDQAKRIREALNQKPRPSPMIELMDTLKQTAIEIADREPDPNDWVDWVVYILELLQAEAEKDFKAENFEIMLVTLRDCLDTRVDKGKW